MVRYQIKNSDPHWDALWNEILVHEDGKIEYPYDIDSYLRRYRGRTYIDQQFTELKVVQGIEFDTEEDLVYFKLKFN